MSEPGSWNAPDGWGGPTQPPPPGGQPAPPYGQPAPPYAQQPYAQQPWGYQALKPGVVPLRPLGLGELLDGAVAIVRRYPRPTLGLSAIIALVTTLINIVLLTVAFRPFVELDQAAIEAGDTDALLGAVGPAVAGFGVTLVLAVLGGTIMTGAITAVVGKAVLGEPLTFSETWKQVRGELPRLLVLAVLVVLLCAGVVLLSFAVGIGLLAVSGWLGLIGVPLILASIAAALYLYYRLVLAPCVMVLERAAILPSMRRSGVLVKGDWWRVFGILLLTSIIAGIVSQIVQAPFAILGTGGVSGLVNPGDELFGVRYLTMSALGQGLAATLITPFSAGVLALLYVDRRMRAEGLDVALAAAAHARPRS